MPVFGVLLGYILFYLEAYTFSVTGILGAEYSC